MPENSIDLSFNKVHQMNCLEGFRALPNGSVQTVMTSPPYWQLRDYEVSGQWGQERTPEEFVAHLVELGKEIRRTLTPNGSFWLNLGDSYYESGMGAHSYLKPKDLVCIPWLTAMALQKDGWFLRCDIVWHKLNTTPEGKCGRPRRVHEYLFFLSRGPDPLYDEMEVLEPYAESSLQQLQNDFRRKRAGKAVAKGGYANPEGKKSVEMCNQYRGELKASAGSRKTTVWSLRNEPYHGEHYAPYPKTLVEPCILACSKPGDLVADPFAGSGTTGIVAVRNGRRFVGFDLAGGDKDLGGHTANQRIALAAVS